MQVSDGKDADHNTNYAVDDFITVIIDLTNVDEPGKVILSATQLQVGSPLTAVLTDPDGSVSDIDCLWERSPDPDRASGWKTINGASSDAYTPVAADVDMYLRATAEYTDAEGTGKSAAGTSVDSIQALPTIDTSLDSLSLTRISINFSSSTLQYSADVSNNVKRTTVTVSPTAASGTTVEITPSDSRPGKGGHQVNLDVGENEISITVWEDGGSSSTTYIVNVSREESEEDDNLEPPDPEPQVPQNNPPNDCASDYRAGLVAYCGESRFASHWVELDGRYTIDWSEWHASNPDVTGYTIVLDEFFYKMYYDENGQVSDSSLTGLYESCEFADGSWRCEGPPTYNIMEDSDGTATQPREVASNVNLTEWSLALDAPGRMMVEETFQQRSGDATDPNNEPTPVILQIALIEMDLYYFRPHTNSGSRRMGVVLVNGSDGFDIR